MKTEEAFKDVIHDMGSEPFFLHYHSGEQTHLYRGYCHQNKYPRLIIDATGSVVTNFKKFGIIKTKHIFLYEALVYDPINKHSFTATNMLSERHTNLAIFNWLAKWVNSNVPRPKEAVCDQSLALLSAIVQCFTQYSSLHEYLNICSEFILGDLDVDSHWLPLCYVRTDVAHFIKLASKWIPLKTVHKRVREVILRTIGLLIKCQSLNEIYLLVFSLFVVLINETDGNDVQTGIQTECEKHKQYIIRATSTGMKNFEEQFNTIIGEAETEDEVHKLVENELNKQYEGLENYNNPFESWAQEIYEKSKLSLTEGTGINPMYLPTLVPHIIKCFKLLPLWSGIMLPVFGYGDETANSAAVESSFNKVKNSTFKHISLPTDIELFLEQHITSLRGAALLRSNQTVSLSPSLEGNLNDLDNICAEKLQESCDTDCPLCKTGNLPSENGLHKCIVCNVPVHALPSCSTYTSDEEEKRVCLMCSNNTATVNNLTDEDVSVESWKRQRLQKSRSYLYPNSSLQHLRMNNTKNIRSLPILKNGSRADELKSCTVENIGKVIMSNTCAFDTVASILMVSYSDSTEYGNKVDSCSNTFLTFVAGLVRDGITASTYSNRAEIMVNTKIIFYFLNNL